MAKSAKRRDTKRKVSKNTQLKFLKRILNNNSILNKLFNG